MTLVSIIIVNWNGIGWLKSCLESIQKQTYGNIEVIVVDNASADDSIGFINENFPWVKTVANIRNDGFAQGNNLGFEYSRGEFILLLNNDTVIEESLVEVLVSRVALDPSIGSIQPRLILMNDRDRVDSCGSFFTKCTVLYHYGNQKIYIDKYNKELQVFTNKGACMMIRRELIEKFGLFDPSFWCYYEETDFCHRIQIFGFKSIYYPMASCFHANGSSSKKFNNHYIQFHNFKNKTSSYIKNFESINLLWVLPIHFIISIFYSFIFFIRLDIRSSLSFPKSIYFTFCNIKKILKERKKIQDQRKVSDKELLRQVTKSPRLSYYYFLIAGIEKYID